MMTLNASVAQPGIVGHRGGRSTDISSLRWHAIDSLHCAVSCVQRVEVQTPIFQGFAWRDFHKNKLSRIDPAALNYSVYRLDRLWSGYFCHQRPSSSVLLLEHAAIHYNTLTLDNLVAHGRHKKSKTPNYASRWEHNAAMEKEVRKLSSHLWSRGCRCPSKCVA
jgi:hypothetical protein